MSLAQIAPAALALSVWVGCYDVPEPACGFVCGPSGECPASYTCNAADNYCHHDDAPPSLVCAPPDAAIDAFVDLTPPTIASRIPPHDATDVSPHQIIRVTFSEHVIGVTPDSFQALVDDEPIAAAVDYDADTWIAQLAPERRLPSATQIHVRLLPGITDAAGNPLAPALWSFRTLPDTEGPLVVSRSPVPDATGVAVDTTISVSFDEAIIDVSALNFWLRREAVPVATTLAYHPSTLTAVLHPEIQLAANTTYAVAVSGVQDLSGNVLQGSPVTWSFTTGADTVPPRVVESAPLDGSTGVPTTASLWFSFDEPVTGVDASTCLVEDATHAEPIPGAFTSWDDGLRWTFTPSAPLPPSTPITVKLTAGITDTATPPNALVPVTISFTTGS